MRVRTTRVLAQVHDTVPQGEAQPIDTTGDGHANAVGFDTTGDGKIDAFDTTNDGRIDAWDTTVSLDASVGVALINETSSVFTCLDSYCTSGRCQA